MKKTAKKKTSKFSADDIANQLNISRQAVIKSYLRQALDQHYLAKSKAS